MEKRLPLGRGGLDNLATVCLLFVVRRRPFLEEVFVILEKVLVILATARLATRRGRLERSFSTQPKRLLKMITGAQNVDFGTQRCVSKRRLKQIRNVAQIWPIRLIALGIAFSQWPLQGLQDFRMLSVPPTVIYIMNYQ